MKLQIKLSNNVLVTFVNCYASFWTYLYSPLSANSEIDEKGKGYSRIANLEAREAL